MWLHGPGPGQMNSDPDSGYGICDPGSLRNPYGFVRWREDTGLFKLSREAGPPIRATIAAGTELNLFSKGRGEEDTANGWPVGVKKTAAETLAFKEGAMVAESRDDFEVHGMMIEVERPFILVDRGGGLPLRAGYPPWLDNYDEQIREAFLKRTFVQYKHGEDDCDWLLGKPARWPTNGGPTGPIVSNGANAAIGMYVPLAAAERSGARVTDRQLRVRIVVGALPLDFESLTDAAQDIDTDIMVPVSAVAIGMPVSSRCRPLCAPPRATPAEIEAAVDSIFANLSPQQVLEVVRRKMAADRNGGGSGNGGGGGGGGGQKVPG